MERHPPRCHAAPERPGPRPPPHPEAEGVLRVSPGPAPGSAHPLRRAARPGRSASLLSTRRVRAAARRDPSQRTTHALRRHRPPRASLARCRAGRADHPVRERAVPARERAVPPRERARPGCVGAPYREGSRPGDGRPPVIHSPVRPILVGAVAGDPERRGVAGRLAGRAGHRRARPRGRDRGPHRGRGVPQRGVPGPDHLDHGSADHLEGRGQHAVPGRARPPAGGGRRPSGPGRPGLEPAGPVSR
jgi:hypothetical protein